jgi:hypothetical protein
LYVKLVNLCFTQHIKDMDSNASQDDEVISSSPKASSSMVPLQDGAGGGPSLVVTRRSTRLMGVRQGVSAAGN